LEALLEAAGIGKLSSLGGLGHVAAAAAAAASGGSNSANEKGHLNDPEVCLFASAF